VYATEVVHTLQKAGIRAEIDVSNSKINYKVREHSNQKIPFILAVGGREMEDRTVAIRRLGSDAQETVALDKATEMLLKEAAMPA
jgi:threonyl-tRNA synthetase